MLLAKDVRGGGGGVLVVVRGCLPCPDAGGALNLGQHRVTGSCEMGGRSLLKCCFQVEARVEQQTVMWWRRHLITVAKRGLMCYQRCCLKFSSSRVRLWQWSMVGRLWKMRVWRKEWSKIWCFFPVGLRPVLVHGGDAEINQWLGKLGPNLNSRMDSQLQMLLQRQLWRWCWWARCVSSFFFCYFFWLLLEFGNLFVWCFWGLLRIKGLGSWRLWDAVAMGKLWRLMQVSCFSPWASLNIANWLCLPHELPSHRWTSHLFLWSIEQAVVLLANW